MQSNTSAKKSRFQEGKGRLTSVFTIFFVTLNLMGCTFIKRKLGMKFPVQGGCETWTVSKLTMCMEFSGFNDKELDERKRQCKATNDLFSAGTAPQAAPLASSQWQNRCSLQTAVGKCLMVGTPRTEIYTYESAGMVSKEQVKSIAKISCELDRGNAWTNLN